MSRLRTNVITNRMANGAPTVSNGLIISGVSTTSDIKVGTGVTLNVYGGATYSGIVTASSFRGDGSQLSNVTSTTINNNANNRLITGSGTANTLEGEANLTFDGSSLDIFNGSNSSTIKLKRHASTASEQAHIGYFSSGLHIETRESTYISLKTNTQERVRVTSDGHFRPAANSTYDLGMSGSAWRNLYVNDAHFSNEGGSNSVDGTWGSWTLQEGENDIFMINNRTGKKYAITMKEVE